MEDPTVLDGDMPLAQFFVKSVYPSVRAVVTFAGVHTPESTFNLAAIHWCASMYHASELVEGLDTTVLMMVYHVTEHKSVFSVGVERPFPYGHGMARDDVFANVQ